MGVILDPCAARIVWLLLDHGRFQFYGKGCVETLHFNQRSGLLDALLCYPILIDIRASGEKLSNRGGENVQSHNAFTFVPRLPQSIVPGSEWSGSTGFACQRH